MRLLQGNIRSFLFIILSFTAFSINADNFISGSGNVITESRQVSNFTNISIMGAGEVYITQGDKESLKIQAEDNIIPLLETIVSDNTLTIAPKHVSFTPNKQITYYITMKNLEGINAMGAAEINVDGTFKMDTLTLDIRGAETVILKNIVAQSLIAQMSGQTSVTISGKAEKQSVTQRGAGIFDGTNLSGKEGNVAVSGLGNVKINVADKLDIKIYGTGRVTYYGKPLISQMVSGAGKIIPG